MRPRPTIAMGDFWIFHSKTAYMNPFNRLLLCALVLLTSLAADAASAQPATARSPEQLRGQITPERAWWDLQHYDLAVEAVSYTHLTLPTNREV